MARSFDRAIFVAGIPSISVMLSPMALSFLKRLWRALPLRLTLVLVLLLWIAKENYPFPHFPMYSNFTDFDYVVFVADQNGDALPLEYVSLGTRTARLKKQYNGLVNKERKKLKTESGTPRKQDLTIEQRRPAGEEALNWLWSTVQSKSTKRLEGVTELQLYQISIFREDGKIVTPEPEHIATLQIDDK